MGYTVGKTQCGRCGIETHAEFCTACRSVDPEFCRGGRNADENIKYRTQQKLQAENAEFWSWVSQMNYRRKK